MCNSHQIIHLVEINYKTLWYILLILIHALKTQWKKWLWYIKSWSKNRETLGIIGHERLLGFKNRKFLAILIYRIETKKYNFLRLYVRREFPFSRLKCCIWPNSFLKRRKSKFLCFLRKRIRSKWTFYSRNLLHILRTLQNWFWKGFLFLYPDSKIDFWVKNNIFQHNKVLSKKSIYYNLLFHSNQNTIITKKMDHNGYRDEIFPEKLFFLDFSKFWKNLEKISAHL